MLYRRRVCDDLHRLLRRLLLQRDHLVLHLLPHRVLPARAALEHVRQLVEHQVLLRARLRAQLQLLPHLRAERRECDRDHQQDIVSSHRILRVNYYVSFTSSSSSSLIVFRSHSFVFLIFKFTSIMLVKLRNTRPISHASNGTIYCPLRRPRAT